MRIKGKIGDEKLKYGGDKVLIAKQINNGNIEHRRAIFRILRSLLTKEDFEDL